MDKKVKVTFKAPGESKAHLRGVTLRSGETLEMLEKDVPNGLFNSKYYIITDMKDNIITKIIEKPKIKARVGISRTSSKKKKVIKKKKK